MKKFIVFCYIISCLFVLSSCGCEDWENSSTEDPENYQSIVSSVGMAEFFPDTIDGYTVKSFSYSASSAFDDCREVFLDIIVKQDEFDSLLAQARQYPYFEETGGYHADGYYEIVFQDSYAWEKYEEVDAILHADIQKVIYNTDTRNIVFVDFSTTYPSPLKNTVYFDWLGIGLTEYEDRYARLYGY